MEENREKETAGIDFQQENVRLNYENNLLKQRLKEAYNQIDMLSDQRGIERIKFLFAVADSKNGCFSPEFVARAVEEIEETMYPKEEEEKHE